MNDRPPSLRARLGRRHELNVPSAVGLFLVLVVVPACLLYRQVDTLIREEGEWWRQTVQQRLALHGDAFQQRATDKAMMPALFWLPRRSGWPALVRRALALQPETPLRTYRPLLVADLEAVRQEANRQRRDYLVTAMGALGVALLLGGLLAGQVLRPIRDLHEAFDGVRAGDLARELPAVGTDELAAIARSFNAMLAHLRERERMRAYVSPTVREAVSDAQHGKTAAGEVREMTVLFSGIRGFTALCETHPPPAMFAMLNGFFAGVERRVAPFGGEIDKFIGDAVMIVFRQPGPDQAAAAVRAALAMRDWLAEFNAGRRAAGLFPIEIGIGMCTGRLMQGDVGGESRKDLTIIGDEVNLAARLETASKQGRYTRIVLAESTWERVRDRVEAVEMPVDEVKGKAQRVRMFEVVRWRGAPRERGQE